jgi:25S rRNA (cytosine2278-C5)-methyltransferase
VKRVVYSTCSIHAEENERVVVAVLDEMDGWRVLRKDEQPDGLRIWHRFGLPEECASKDIAEGCIRCEKGTDGTIGFFAVALVRESLSTNGVNYIDNMEEEAEWQGIP